MITHEERKSIIAEAVEQTLKLIPEVVGNLMVANTMYSKLTTEFYQKNPTFEKHKEIVQEVVSKIEGADPTKSYEDILSEAIPEIKKAISLKGKVTMDGPKRGELDLSFPSDNGAI